MTISFEYTPTKEDYLNYEKFAEKMKRQRPILIIVGMMITASTVYTSVVNKKIDLFQIVATIAILTAIVLCLFLQNSVFPQKRVNWYIKKDPSYFSPMEFTVNEKAIEIKTKPQNNEMGTVCIYPYSIMSIIYETNEYFYFVLGNEVKILPKNVIPRETRIQAFEEIRYNRNYVRVK